MNKTLLFQLGHGNVGQAFIEVIQEHNKKKPDHVIQHIGLVNSRNWHYDPTGLEMDQLSWVVRPTDFKSILSSIIRQSNKVVLVDVTASQDTVKALVKGAELGFSLLLANKYPLVESMEVFKQLATQNLGCSATVGSGLPILPKIQALQDGGKRITKVEACLSGTLGTLCSQLERGKPFSAIIREAHQKGYTEPDPREDLAGNDVARKVLVISRMMGYSNELAQVEIESLYPPAMNGLSVDDFLNQLSILDPIYAKRFNEAAQHNNTLRFVVTIEQGKCKVGLKEVPKDSPIGQTEGADKICMITSHTSPDTPLLIKGGGAGAKSTAEDLLQDLLHMTTTTLPANS